MSAVQKSAPDPALVLGKATIRAAEMLGLRNSGLARVIGVSEPTLSRIANHDRGIAPDSKEGELALMLVRVFRSLDPLVGGNDQLRREWMNAHNKALNSKPVDLINRVDGLTVTLAYLDGMRAPA